MDRDRLKRYLDEGLSLNQIGALENRDPSTVGYWVKKHGFVANGRTKYAAKGAVDPDRLASLVKKGTPLREIAESLDRSQSTIRHWIAKLGLSTPIAVRHRPRDKAREAGMRTFVAACKSHGETTFVIENSGRTRCRKCRMHAVTEWRRRSKDTLAEEAGGECLICGYRRCLAALHFHHVDPETKEFHLSNAGKPRSIEKLREEAKKCVLLCANCHAEVEAGVTECPKLPPEDEVSGPT